MKLAGGKGFQMRVEQSVQVLDGKEEINAYPE